MDARARPPGARRPRVDLADLADAFDDASREAPAYLDLDTGAVIRTSADVLHELDAIRSELPDEPPDTEAYRAAFAAASERRGVPAWMRAALREADALAEGLGTRFIEVPEADSRAGYADMAAFVETVASPRLRDRLAAAIRGRGAFRRFKDALTDHPAERERWFAFKDARLRERARDWLASEGIEPAGEGDRWEDGSAHRRHFPGSASSRRATASS